MSSSKLTMIGLYNYDPDIFENLTFPEGINKDTAVNEILIRSGEFEVLYPQPEFLKLMITHWGFKHYRTFEKWIEALNIEFEPLYNYDRYEEYDDNTSSRTESDYLSNDSRKTTGSQNAIDRTENDGAAHDTDTHSDHTIEQRDTDYLETVDGSYSKNINDVENTGATESTDRSTNEIENRSDDKTENSVKLSGEEKSASSTDTQTQTALSQTDTNNDSDQTNTRDVAAYDAATYQPKEQETVNTTSGTAGNGLAVTNTDDTKSETGSSNMSETGSANISETGTSAKDTAENESKASLSNTVKTGDETEEHDETRDHDETVQAVNQTAGTSSKDSTNTNTQNSISQTSNVDETTGSTDGSSKSNQVGQTSHRAHLYGNIGVTTSTQMLEDYIRVERFNIYEQIADIFTDEFCIKVY